MKMFWKVLGMEDVYTEKACYRIVDKKTNMEYMIDEGRFFLKKDYPNNILENNMELFEGKFRYDYYYKISDKPDYIEKKGIFGKSRQVYSKVPTHLLGTKYEGLFGLWKIEDLDVYTDIAADYIRDKATGKEYKRSERELFRGEDMTPFPLAEHTDKYEFIYEEASSVANNDLQEICTTLTLNSIFHKK